MIFRLVLFAAAAALFFLSPVLGMRLDSLSGRLWERVRPEEGEDGADREGEDLLDNKKKWRILMAGYAVFALILLVLLFSVFTLNRKINSLYGSLRHLEETVYSSPEGAAPGEDK